MTADLDPLAVVRRRLRAQRLSGGAPFATPVEAVAWSGGVQAQEYAEALWSLAMRVRDVDLAAVEAACDRGEILRTHVMRPTWHFVAAADLRWLLRLTAPRIQSGNAGRYRQLGLDPGTLARCDEVFAAALAGGEPHTRRELGAALEAAGIDPAGQRLPHALLHAELAGVVVSGPRRGKHHTYVRFADRVPAAPARSREEDVAELAAPLLHEPRAGDPARLRVVVGADDRRRKGRGRRTRRRPGRRGGRGRDAVDLGDARG